MTAFVDIGWTAPVAAVAGTISIGDMLVWTGSGYVKATAANRTTYGKPDGIAATAGSSANPVTVIPLGPVSATITGLGTGAAGPVRVSSAGVLERVATPSSSDDVVGYCFTDGRAFLVCGGAITHRVYVDSGGGGGGTPGGASGDLQTNNAGAFGGLSPGASGNLCVSNGSAWTSAAPSFAASAISSGTLALVRGGLAADASAYSGLVKITGGASSAVAAPAGAVVGDSDAQVLTNKTINGASNTLTVRIANDVSGLAAGVATFLATPSGANLAAALTSALSVSKGGTGVTSLTGFTTDITTTGVITAQRAVFTGVITNTTTGVQNDISSTGANMIRCTGAALEVNGIAGGTDGRIVFLAAIGGNVVLHQEAAGSAAANRLALQSEPATIWQNTVVPLIYDGTSSRWRELCTLARA